MVVLVVLFVGGGTATPATADPGDTTRIAVGPGGAAPDGDSYFPAFSSDANLVAFRSEARNLGPSMGFYSYRQNIFVYDRTAGTTERITVSHDGTEVLGETSGPAISGDGRYVAFMSYSSNLVPGDTDNGASLFVRDRVTDQTEYLSPLGSMNANEPVSMSADGRYIAFHATWSLASPYASGGVSIYVYDRDTDTIVNACVSTEGGAANSACAEGQISRDGRWVVFRSEATSLVQPDTNARADIFLRDLVTGTTTRVNESDLGDQANGHSLYPSVNEDGTIVSFWSDASNLLGTDDQNGVPDIFVYDVASDTMSLGSLGDDEQQGDLGSYGRASLDPSGDRLAFISCDTNLLATPDTNGACDTYVRDLTSDSTVLASVSSTGVAADQDSHYPVMGLDGSEVAFSSRSTTLVNGSLGVQELLLHQLAPSGPSTFELSVQVDGHGEVTGGGIDCDQTTTPCAEDVPAGDQVTLTPSPDQGWAFDGWSGACSGGGTCAPDMTQNRSVTATFTAVADGQPFGWGYNPFGQVGDGSTVANRPTPRRVSGLVDVTSLSAGFYHSLAATSDGDAWSWGLDSAGQLGDGTVSPNVDPNPTPQPIPGLTSIEAVSGGGYHSLALRSDGTVWAWGRDMFGQLGNGSAGASDPVPHQIPGLSDVVAISAGGNHSLALRANGTVWAWGWDEYGQMGDGTAGGLDPTPGQVPGLTNVVQIAAGASHNLARRSDGTVWSWGSDSSGQLGDGVASPTNPADPHPDQVVGLPSASTIAAGTRHSIAIDSTGAVWTWGADESGQLGDGTAGGDDPTPLAVPGLGDADEVSAGTTSSYAIMLDGTVRSWGGNAVGSLGIGTAADGNHPDPVTVSAIADVDVISAGSAHALAMSGTVVPVGKEVTQTVAAGGTVTTDAGNNGVSDTDPIEANVTSPNAGTVTIEAAPAAGTPDSGFALAGQAITITAPPATSSAPLVLVFEIDSTRIPPPQTASTIVVLRNGVAVSFCTGGPVVASPDPCVAARQTAPGGDAVVTVRTSAASLWELGFSVPVAEAAGPYTVAEGSEVQLDGTASSGEAPLTFDWGSDPSIADPTSATPSFSGVDDGLTVITLTVTDATGSSATDGTSVEVTNGDPVVSLGLPAGPSAAGEPYTLDIDFTDPGPVDTHEVHMDWGDGNDSTPAPTESDGSGSVAPSHVYATGGSYPISVSVIDDDGGTDTIAATANIRDRYVFGGFLQPVDNPEVVNVGKPGKTYPVKFRLSTASGVPITSLAAISSITYKSTSCNAFSGDPADALETTATGGTSLRYDAAAGQYIYNWATPTAKGCYALFVRFDSGQAAAKAYFHLK